MKPTAKDREILGLPLLVVGSVCVSYGLLRVMGLSYDHTMTILLPLFSLIAWRGRVR